MSDEPKAWADSVALRGPDAPHNDGMLKHLIEYLLTVYKRFGNTTVTFSLQWGADALCKQDAQKERIASLEQELDTLIEKGALLQRAERAEAALAIATAQGAQVKDAGNG